VLKTSRHQAGILRETAMTASANLPGIPLSISIEMAYNHPIYAITDFWFVGI
jgi:hypothetical protein